MQLCFLCLSTLVFASWAAPTVEDALTFDDECQSSEDPSACSWNALQVRASKKLAEESSCMPVNQWCGNNYAEKPCCGDGNQCMPDGNIWKCKAGGYGGNGGHGGNHGGDGGHGGNDGWCKQVGEVCGGRYRSPSQCCGGAICANTWDNDDTMRCVMESYSQPEPEQPQCAAVNEECGGLLSWSSTPCCSPRAICKQFWSDLARRCVEPEAEPQCVPINGICGGPRQEIQQCCTGWCRSPWWDPTGQMTCQY